MSGISRNEWLAALGDSVQPADQDAITAPELAALLGISDIAAYRRVKRLIAERRAVRTFKVIVTGAGITRRVPAYKLLKPAKK